jgi:hypothetical protein
MVDSGKESPKELRRFGVVMTVGLVVVGILLLWRGRMLGPYVVGLAALFLLTGLLLPRALIPVERVWMRFARVFGIVMTYVLLTLTFYIIITPMGVLLRLLGKDLLQLSFPRRRESIPQQRTNWVAVEPDGPCSRADKPY